jgi:single-strand DNA-binding protein
MPSFNKITIVGYLGRDAEQRFTPGGMAVASFSVATTEKRKDGEKTTWFRVSLFGKQAENIAPYLTKGKLVFVEGRLRQEEYTTKDGATRTALEVNATDLQLISGPNDTPRAEAARPASAPQPSAKSSTSNPVTYTGDDDDDIPF